LFYEFQSDSYQLTEKFSIRPVSCKFSTNEGPFIELIGASPRKVASKLLTS
jgi:hypothetical protein